MQEVTLSPDQQAAYNAFTGFLANPAEKYFVLEGYSGTGKTTLVRTLINDLDKIHKTIRLICPTIEEREILLTATTNKAAEAFSQITGQTVATIHSALLLRVHTDYNTQKTSLRPKDHHHTISDTLLFIDEASFIDENLLTLIKKMTPRSKVVFIGDPAQLLNVGSDQAVVFNSGFLTAKLTQVMRQANGNPIIELATLFRETVNTGEFFSFKPDGVHIRPVPRDQFNQEVEQEFSRSSWRFNDSKVLAWTNRRVINYNRWLYEQIKGDPEFAVGDYAVCNSHVSSGSHKISTDALVRISGISPLQLCHGVQGRFYELDCKQEFFMPSDPEAKKARYGRAFTFGEIDVLQAINESWIDLRAAYAQTINKSQGSTYDTVFLDLDDVAKCRDNNTLARMLYVGISRARQTVVITGDLV